VIFKSISGMQHSDTGGPAEKDFQLRTAEGIPITGRNSSAFLKSKVSHRPLGEKAAVRLKVSFSKTANALYLQGNE